MEWLRWYHGACSDAKWPLIARKSGTCVGIVVSVWAALLEQASQDEERGSIEGFDPETYDVLYGYEDGTCAAVLAAMADKGLIADGCIAAWQKRQPKRERDDLSTERVRRYREKKRQQAEISPVSDGVTEDETECNAMKRHVTPCNATRTEQRREEKYTPPLPPHGGRCAVLPEPQTQGESPDDLPPMVKRPENPDPGDPDGCGVDFAQVVDAYPEGHVAPRGEAARVWLRLKAQGKLPGLPRMLQAIEAWSDSEEWAKDGGKYIPKLANFLRNHQWEDRPRPQCLSDDWQKAQIARMTRQLEAFDRQRGYVPREEGALSA